MGGEGGQGEEGEEGEEGSVKGASSEFHPPASPGGVPICVSPLFSVTLCNPSGDCRPH